MASAYVPEYNDRKEDEPMHLVLHIFNKLDPKKNFQIEINLPCIYNSTTRLVNTEYLLNNKGLNQNCDGKISEVFEDQPIMIYFTNDQVEASTKLLKN
jgi:hypothetical protein